MEFAEGIVRDHNRRRLGRILDYVGKQGWEIVLVSELNSDQEGVIWLGEERDRVAIVHGRKTGIILRRESLECRMREGAKEMVRREGGSCHPRGI